MTLLCQQLLAPKTPKRCERKTAWLSVFHQCNNEPALRKTFIYLVKRHDLLWKKLKQWNQSRPEKPATALQLLFVGAVAGICSVERNNLTRQSNSWPRHNLNKLAKSPFILSKADYSWRCQSDRFHHLFIFHAFEKKLQLVLSQPEQIY